MLRGAHMTMGIYCYIDRKDNKIIYIGKDSSIDIHKRHNDHFYPSNYNYQKINQVLQNNPDRYIYQVLVWDVATQDRLNALEIQYIRHLNPKFNFTEGGEGVLGWRHSEEAKQKMRQPRPSIQGENHPFYNKHHTKETKEKLSQIGKALWEDPNSIFNSQEYRKKLSENNSRYWSGKKRTEKCKKKISQTLSQKYNKTGFYRVSQEYNKRYKKGFRWAYSYRQDNQKKKVSAMDLETLKNRVLEKQLEWRILDEEKSQKSLKEDQI